MLGTILLKSLRKFTLSEPEFLSLSSIKIEELSTKAEQLDQELDISSTGSVLTIRKGQHTIVINRQTPNKQIWYSCTISGPMRFDYLGAQWLNQKQESIDKIMEKDIKTMLL